MEFVWEAEDGIFIKYEVVVYVDGSGSVKYYSMDLLTYDMTWDALGNGTWTFYVGGEVYLSGLWTSEGAHD